MRTSRGLIKVGSIPTTSTNTDTAKAFTEIFAVAVAQLVELQFVALNVAGSSPVGHPNKMDP